MVPEEVGRVRLVLPIDFIAASAAPFVELAKNLVAKLDFASATAATPSTGTTWGISPDAEREALPLGQRRPGMTFRTSTGMLFVIPRGIKCVNWLTFRNAAYCKKLGGLEKLRGIWGRTLPSTCCPRGDDSGGGAAGDRRRQPPSSAPSTARSARCWRRCGPRTTPASSRLGDGPR